MAGVAWPDVRAALVARLEDVLTGYTVYDGPVVSGDNPTHYLSVGDQPSNGDSASAGSFEQSVGMDGFSAAEVGTVLGELGGTTGDATVPDVFGAFSLIAAHLQSDLTLGGALFPASTITASAEVVETQTTAGAVQRLLVSFNYTALVP